MTPEDVTYNDVQWTSSNVDFATVSDQGLVTAVDGDGYSIVQVAPVGLHEGSGINANLKVVVSSLHDVIAAVAKPIISIMAYILLLFRFIVLLF